MRVTSLQLNGVQAMLDGLDTGMKTVRASLAKMQEEVRPFLLQHRHLSCLWCPSVPCLDPWLPSV